MKKLTTIFVLLLSIASLSSFAQKQLELKDTTSGKVKVFKIGQQIRYKGLEDTDYEKVKIQNITATTVVFYLPDEDEGSPIREVPLSEIKSIQKATTIHNVSRVIGGFLMVGGAYTMASSGALADNSGGSSGGYLGLGAGMLVAGVIPYLIKPKVYELGKTHTATIR
jgi:predicted phage tail protein